MTAAQNQIKKLFQIRNQFGNEFLIDKKQLLQSIDVKKLRSKKLIDVFYNTLLFIVAYPDNKIVYDLATAKLVELIECIKADSANEIRFFNSGLVGGLICSQFGFEMVKWLRNQFGNNVQIDSIAAPDSQVRYIITAMLPQIESEILEDENSTWKQWLSDFTDEGEDLLDSLINLFDQSTLRPEAKDELWNSLVIFVSFRFLGPCKLPDHLIVVNYHKTIVRKASLTVRSNDKIVKAKLKLSDAEKIIECARVVLVSQTREIDPISFSDPASVTYYYLPRGLSIALFGMHTDRRHPIDCYMGYMVFKNGWPIGYAGSWVLFDSARIGLNIFSTYRGGESLFVFEQILKLHKHVYHLKRFSVDPYQIGKNNSDGIKSGAFWLYYKFGFRHLNNELRELANIERKKILTQKGYRSSYQTMKLLAGGRLELILDRSTTVSFDVTDLSLAYRAIVKSKYAGNRKLAIQDARSKLLKILRMQALIADENLNYVINNWCVILMSSLETWKNDEVMLATLKEMFYLKVNGNEEDYIRLLQRSKKFIQLIKATLI